MGTPALTIAQEVRDDETTPSQSLVPVTIFPFLASASHE